ncbi:hypothetical protein NKG05_00910 [Oerskovia sp. M15]
MLKALGASTSYLLRDAIGQALVLLVLGVGVGTALAAGAGRSPPRSCPSSSLPPRRSCPRSSSWSSGRSAPSRRSSGSRASTRTRRSRPVDPAATPLHEHAYERHTMDLTLDHVTLVYPDGESTVTAVDDVS